MNINSRSMVFYIMERTETMAHAANDRMTLIANKVTWKIFSGLAIALAGTLTKKAVDKGWKAVTKDDPPHDLAAKEVSFKTAILWTGISTLATAMAIVLAKRGVAREWVKTTGKYPPVK